MISILRKGRLFMSMKVVTGALVALCMALPVQAAEVKENPADVVVATVNGEKITLQEVEKVHANNAQLSSVPLKNIYEPLLDNMIDLSIVTSEAKAQKIQDTPEFKEMMQE